MNDPAQPGGWANLGIGYPGQLGPLLPTIYLALLCILVQCNRGMTLSKDLVAASATPLILSILTGGESYGYAIIKRVRKVSGGGIQWTDGMLYPVLHRLAKQGLIDSHWRVAETGRRRKYYSLTVGGNAALELERQHWMLVDRTLRTLWDDPSLTSSKP